MATRHRVTGESVVLWAVELDADDYVQAGPAAVEFVQDMLQLEGFGAIAAKVESQQDRILKIRQLTEEKDDGDDSTEG